MAYIHVTSNCNMNCAHCLNEYSKFRPGRNMGMTTYKNALKYIGQNDDYVCLGGGEPTLNPHLKRMIRMAVEATEHVGIGVLVVTNGSNEEMIRWMLDYEDMVGSDKFWSELSTDRYHDRSIVKPWVFETYKRRKQCRNNEHAIIPLGRAAKLDPLFHHIIEMDKPCVCSTNVIYVDGKVTWCGCKDSHVIGNVNTGAKLPESYFFNSGECWHHMDEEIKKNPNNVPVEV